MSGLPTFNFKLPQIYPGSGEYHLNTCANPDCTNFGHPLTGRAERVAEWSAKIPNITPEQTRLVMIHGPGAYKLAGSEPKFKRVTKAFQYQNDPHVWSDQRSVRCLGHTSDGRVCDSGFSILSPDHLDEEIIRLRNMNGVLDGPCCGACGKRVLEDPDSFALDGFHERSKDRKGKALKKKANPTGLRVVHSPCRGKKGARFTISLPHAGQKQTSDNIRVLGALLNSAGIGDIQRIIGVAATGKKIGMSRIYDRILWLEAVLLAYEREMLRRWKEAVEKSGEPVEHILCHDDQVFTVNWETSSDRRNTQLNCAITADVVSGYVFRADFDFNPMVTPLDVFNAAYLDENGQPQNLEEHYTGGKITSAPKFSWQRPTGGLHEPQFFAACVNAYKVFRDKARRTMPETTDVEKAAKEHVIDQANGAIKTIETIAHDWFGFPVDKSHERGSFKGSTTRDTYTKAAHFILVRELLPFGKITLTTEQEATLPNTLPHIFQQEIKEDRFCWMAMAFNKTATKPERLGKIKIYRKKRSQFLNEGMYDGVFTEQTDSRTISEAFIQKFMKVATRDEERTLPFQISNYEIDSFPKVWIHAPTQASGEIDKTVGFPILPRALRRELKKVPFNVEKLSDEMKSELAPWVYKATLQPVSSFMNALRERLSAAQRTGGGGARMTGTYIQGAIYNPRILIALVNIFRIHYNFFEPRPYASPFDEIDDMIDPPKMTPRSLKMPGTDQVIDLPPKIRRTPARATPAMRMGMDAITKRKNGADDVPNIHRVLYRPWIFANTQFFAKFERSRNRTTKTQCRESASNSQTSRKNAVPSLRR